MGIEKILEEIIKSSSSESIVGIVDDIVELLNNLNDSSEIIGDENFRQWISDYCTYWSNAHNLVEDIDTFKIESGELLESLRDQSMMDFEL
jgi:hypothetical protein